jgi:Sec-independent protein translocase protein TatA
MEFLGVGPLELLLVFVLALILLGPREMVNTARKAAVAIRKVTQSDFWKDAVDSSREFRQLPTQIMKETGLDEELRKINSDLSRNQDQATWEKDVQKIKPEAQPTGQTQDKIEKPGEGESSDRT